MQNQCAGKEISIINIDASDDETVGFLEHIGLKPTVEQFEMTFSIQT